VFVCCLRIELGCSYMVSWRGREDYFLPWALGGDFTLLESHAFGLLLASETCGKRGHGGIYQAFQ
jgi:hypothetical protein